MTTEKQNKVWFCLPKEVRGQLKTLHKTWSNSLIQNILNYIFGNHNLTSDTEPEEMLMISKAKVTERIHYLYSHPAHIAAHKADERADELRSLFGDKCLFGKPDKEEQAKPKFEVGQLVKSEGKVCRVLEYNYGREFPYLIHKPYNNAKIYVLESDLEPYTEEKNNMEEKELNLCELLKGCEGEEFYSPSYGVSILEVVHTPSVKTPRYYLLIRPKSYTVGRELILPNGCIGEGGMVMLYPSRALYEKYPLDARKAWAEWAESRKPKRWRAEYGDTYYSLRNDFSVCDQTENSDSYNDMAWDAYNYFRTEEEAQQAAEGIRDYLQKFHEKNSKK